MKTLALAALCIALMVAQTSAQVTHPPVRRPLPHICPRGQTWQYGCLRYAPAPPGKLFGACLRMGYGCMRAPSQIQ